MRGILKPKVRKDFARAPKVISNTADQRKRGRPMSGGALRDNLLDESFILVRLAVI